MQMRFAVGEKLYLERLECVAHIVDTREQRRDYHRCPVLLRHAMLVQIEARQRMRRQQRRHQLVQHRDRDVESGEERQQQEKQHRLARIGCDQQHHDERCEHHEHRESADEHCVRMSVHRTFDFLTNRRRIAGQLLERGDTIVDQPEANM